MEEIVYLNGEMLPRARARVSVYDHGFLYGYAVFETMRAYGGVIFRLADHLKRLASAASRIGINLTMSAGDLAGACHATLEANRLKNARVRLTVSRGEVASFPGRHGEGAATVLVTARQYTPLSDEVYRQGYRALVSKIIVSSRSPIADIKSASYLVNTLARMEAEAAVFDEALLLNERGAITEGSTSNVFFVRKGRLITPSLESGILPGVTRAVVNELAGRMGTPVDEREVRLEEAGLFQEAFLTNSVIGLMPLAQIATARGSFDFGTVEEGGVTRRLMLAYRDLVRLETGTE